MAGSPKIKQVDLEALQRLTRLNFKDGRKVRLGRCEITAQEGDESASDKHKDQKVLGIEFFTSRGFYIFPFSIGIDGINALADFAAAKLSRVILVECLVDGWTSDYAQQMAIPLYREKGGRLGERGCRLVRCVPLVPTVEDYLGRIKIPGKLQMAVAGIELWFITQGIGCRLLKQRGFASRKLKAFRLCRPAGAKPLS